MISFILYKIIWLQHNNQEVLFMEYTFFYISTSSILLLLVITACLRRITPAAIITGLVSVGYSTVFDITFGDRLGLYYYISPSKSTLYLTLSAIFIYASANIIYLTFLPERPGRILGYTILWIIGMLLFEYISLMTGTIVFTGWSMLPWSVIAYMATYLWLVLLYRYLGRRMRVVHAA